MCIENPRVRLREPRRLRVTGRHKRQPRQSIGRSRVKKDTLWYSYREIGKGQALRDGELQGNKDKDGEP